MDPRKKLVSCNSHSLMIMLHGGYGPQVGDILKMQGLGMPPPMGHTHPTQSPFILTQHPQSIWMCMFWVILEWKKAYAFESEVGMWNHSQQAAAGGAFR
jgi:hypothetical protein